MRSLQRKAPRGQRDMSRPVHEWRFEVGAPDHGCRLDAFLTARLSWRSREQIQHVIETEMVAILRFKDKQGAPIGRLRSSLRLRLGQEVVVRLPAPQAEIEDGSVAPEPADVVYEDDYLLAVDKPPQRNVYPSRRHRSNSLIEWVHARHRAEHGDVEYFPTPCHRLDRETSGLVLFAKSREVRSDLSRLFEERAVRKLYLAVVEGCPGESSGVIESPLGADSSSSVAMKVAVHPGGLPARTRWRLVRALGAYSILELEPGSGRRHQLRVHLASMGHSILGDKLYGGGDDVFLRSLAAGLTGADRARLSLGRQALHAWRLEFDLERLNARFRFEAPFASDIVRWIRELDNSELPCLQLAAGA